MRKKILIIAGILIGLSVTFLRAADFKTPHRFKPGDVISADVLNEIFDYIESSKKTMTPSDLVGAWQCTKYRPYDGLSEGIPPDYHMSNGNLFISMNNLMLNISEESDGSIKWSSPSRNAFAGIYKIYNASYTPANGRYADECAGNGIIDSIEGDFAVSSNNCLADLSGFGPPTWTYQLDVTRISDTRIKLGNLSFTLLCDLQNIVPAEPLDLRADHTDNNVTLSWTDGSGDEDGFKIVRKDSLDGNWTEIASTAANVGSYTDNVASKGIYWYRVKSYNNNGSSLGSNVVKIIIE